ncbi:23S rRNA pseudouridine2604 synthase [Pseudomonas citronellolis]|uniref:rRNA pseudouridine synthase n=1 Tax=Pseudomonas citronellolis TaxID=53408 RepID=UPI0020A0C7AB|nr:rRNA pseudouridine synthase [Pseudomonas citronellolis]MCP1643710.1 23S rRNA pseudouridine2604 synthase [Pseudomonas citronellolis]MCP1666635.1 23S rRNA pseudouridine2604 synthase [Pseudomonas citronellolis]MCP1697199.1 23S rRNA pseudouridine2604 synthase [Pseudomonas citronellolis]MCP1704174.1 23S rRNA pseudouridine2604 synthase [Pseudomonas citronellolis]MCP1798325.1 23S rRNA pseudouridine2604 synthase [Pseudomonas citronellolis]
MTETTRLSKRLAELLPCSRREAELYIEGGWVTVDGQPVDEPHFRVAEQRVELLPGAIPAPIPPATLLLYKPAGLSAEQALGLLLAANRWEADSAEQRPLSKHFARQQSTTPLDDQAGGLLVFTQNYGVLHRLQDDAATIEHEYLVEVDGSLDDAGLARLRHGLLYQGRPLPALKVSWQNETRLRFAGKGFRPGQIADMCRQVGLKVVGIRRLRLGGVSMGKMEPGQWRYLLPSERF